jgi:peptidyl-dipeptidase Dcp
VTANNDNPLLAQSWDDTLGLPPFGRIKPEHFVPAFETAMAGHLAAIDAIVKAPAATFDNTIVAFETSGLPLNRVAGAFFHLAGVDTNDAIQAIEREMAPKLSRHNSAIYLKEALYKRIDDLWQKRDKLGLNDEQKRVLDRIHVAFVRAGAALDAKGKKRLAEISERLASLGTQFSQNVLADERSFMLVLEGERDLAGLPEGVRGAAAEAARERGMEGQYVVTLGRSSIEPFLQFSTRRDLREKAFEAWLGRGEKDGATDNRPIIAEMMALRAERAKLLGYETFAHYRLADTMAKTPDRVRSLLESVWKRARPKAEAEKRDLQELVAQSGGNFTVAAWDWRHYAEILRKKRFDFDEAELKPYLQLDNIIAATFYTAGRLFDLAFEEVKGLKLYSDDVRVWRVTRAGQDVGLFLGDYFGRPGKRSGAWMGSLRDQQRLTGDVKPIIVNVLSLAKAPERQPTLLSWDDARTIFHEFGHALHGLLSNVTYPTLSGTHVERDFVELPSQLYEHWLDQQDVLKRFAVHAETGEVIPQALIDKVKKAKTFNQGFLTVEYTSSALVDLDLHLLAGTGNVDVVGVERDVLKRIGMPDALVMRHRTPHFAHIFAGDYYAAGYYSYLWSEVLDADAFEAFRETGDSFDAGTAKRLRDFVYSAGRLRDADEAYVKFRGRMPTTDALMRKRGLEPAPSTR